MKKLLFIFGTRPEAIKMAPVIQEARKNPRFEVRVCVTGQHRQMLDQVLNLFGIRPDYDLDIMAPGQSLNEITKKIIEGLDPLFREQRFDLAIVHGDTTSTMASSLAAFHRAIPVAHVEAGLRTGNIHSPWPEEMNRKVAGVLAALHFAPTEASRQNLIQEGVCSTKIVVTGNTVIDALLIANQKIREDSALRCAIEDRFGFLRDPRPFILVTGHRRENFGQKFEDICRGLKRIATELSCQVVYPVHLNPNVQEPVKGILGNADGVHLLAPLEYLPFCHLMEKCKFIITDSGGIQEEAPALGKPVLVMRDTTERPEAVAAGTARLVGTSGDRIFEAARELLSSPAAYKRMSEVANPYGSGDASRIIVQRIDSQLSESDIPTT